MNNHNWFIVIVIMSYNMTIYWRTVKWDGIGVYTRNNMGTGNRPTHQARSLGPRACGYGLYQQWSLDLPSGKLT